MGRCIWLFSLVLIFGPSLLTAAELQLSFEFAGDAEPREGEVAAVLSFNKVPGESQAETASERKREVVSLARDLGKVFELQPARWLIELEAPGFWAETLEIEAGASSQTAHFVLWPLGVVEGTLDFWEERAEAAPEAISLLFSPPPPPSDKTSGETRRPSGSLRCPILDDFKLKCEAPVGEFDLKLSAAGFSDAYYWNVEVQSNKALDLGSIEFGPAAGIVGWVALEGVPGHLDGVEIEVEPRRGRSRRKTADRPDDRASKQRTTTNKRGFFQLSGLAPGAYVIKAKNDPFALAMASVRVKPDRVTEVSNPPLTLRKPQPLQIYVDPPIPPDEIGGLWSARLIQVDQGKTALRRLEPAECSFSGWCEVKSVAVGHYMLRIESTDGKSWSTEDVTIDATTTSHVVEIPMVLVKGSLLFGDEPLEASIYFGTKSGGIEIVSNEEGQFEGILPRPGEWRVEIRAKKPKLRRYFEAVSVDENPVKGYAEVELVLPSTLVEGVVLDEQNLPVPGALVTIKGYDLLYDSFTQQGTNALGEFEFLGLPPGKLLLRAAKVRDSKRLHSEPVVVEVEEKIENPPLELVMREELRLRGRVVAYGRGIPGAYVKAHSPTAMDLGVGKMTTDADGYFEIGVPPGSQEVLIGIGAPGFAYKMARSLLTPDQELVIPLEQTAGQLIIELGESTTERPPQGKILAILHDGGLESPDYLQSFWAPLNGLTERDPDRYVLPWLEAGDYTVCVTDPVQLNHLARQDVALGACLGGYVPAGGELVLDLGAID